MDWEQIKLRFDELQEKYDSGLDVVDEVRELCDSVRKLAHDQGGEESTDIPAAIATKALLVRQLLTVGELTLPAGADDRLRDLARKFAGYVIGPHMESDFNSAVEKYCQEAKEADKLVSTLETQLEELRSHETTLRAYRELLDALLARVDDGGALA